MKPKNKLGLIPDAVGLGVDWDYLDLHITSRFSASEEHDGTWYVTDRSQKWDSDKTRFDTLRDCLEHIASELVKEEYRKLQAYRPTVQEQEAHAPA